MFYKRPSLRRGGISTGIDTLSPRVQAQSGYTPSDFFGNRRMFNFPSINDFARASVSLSGGKLPFQEKMMKSFPMDASQMGVASIVKPTKASGEIEEMDLAEIGGYGVIPPGPKTDLTTVPDWILKAMGTEETRAELKRREESVTTDESDKGFLPKSGPEKAADFSEIAAKVVPNKGDKGDVDKSKDTQPGGEVVEDSFDSEYDKQMKRLEKYLGTDNRETKGRLALALSDAIGTEGTIADKASALNKSLLGIMGQRKKDKRELAKIAFAATTELEKAKIAAGKKGFSERRFDEYANLASKTNRTSAEEKRFEILKDALGIKSGLTGQTAKAAEGLADEIRKDILNLSEAGENEKSSIQADIIGRINALLLLQGVTKDNISGIVGYDVSAYFADGGRVNKAMGGGASETPAEPVATNLTFEQLRTRLPKEITDDIVRLVATSEEALQDFAYIRTQGDVEKFNVKYGVNLVLPQNTA